MNIFIAGTFPDDPITPGVILIETMAQIGVVAFGMYLLACQKNMRPSQMKSRLSLFSLADGVEFKGIVVPGERVIVKGKKIYFRKEAIESGCYYGKRKRRNRLSGEISRNGSGQMKKRVVVTGMGVAAPNAHGLDNFEQALREGRSGIRFIPQLEELKFRLSDCRSAGKF
ncbi:MAG: hypothetical protein MZV70_52660 [Desulfobacterales bacterium]|nr:hypothetical protein [Desulfobacterales bacterium]